MKKSIGFLLIVLLLISFTATCFAFPAPGKYEDLSRILCKLKPDMPGHPLAEKNRQLI